MIAVLTACAVNWQPEQLTAADHRPQLTGTGLTFNGLYEVVKTYGSKIGLKLSPHKLQHSAITLFLDNSGGDVRRGPELADF